jgi:hypothetical protein
MYVMYEAAASCRDISRAAVTNWEGLQDTVRRETRDVSHLLRYSVTIRCYVTVLQYGVTLRCYVTSVDGRLEMVVFLL